MTFDKSIQECLIGRPLSLQLLDSNPPFKVGIVGVGLNTSKFQDEFQITLVIMIIKQIVTIFMIILLAYFLLQKLVLQPTKILNHTQITNNMLSKGIMTNIRIKILL